MSKKVVVGIDYPSNNKVEKPEEKKEVQKVTKGSVKRSKRSLGKRVADELVEDDGKSVKEYILYDVLIPAAKNTISDMVTGGIEMLLFGSTRGSRTVRDRGRSHVSYTNYSQPSHRRPVTPNRRARHNFDDIILASRSDAEEVLSQMVELVDSYGQVTVADFYDLVGITSSFVDNKYGWTNLSRAGVERVRDGYLIDLPRTEEL